MDFSRYLWPAVGVGLVYLGSKVKAVPAELRVPMIAVGSVMAARALPVIGEQV